MRFLISSTLKDIRLRLADPMALLLWLGIPLVLGLLLGLIAGTGSNAVQPHLLLVDQDDSFVSNLLAGGLGQGQNGGFIRIERVTLEDGRTLIDQGKASALLTIPEGFSQAVLREEPTELTLVTNPAQRILPRIIEEGLKILVEGVFYLQRLLGEEMRALADGPPGNDSFFSDQRIAALSSGINRRLRSQENTLFPPVLTVENSVAAADPSATMPFGALFLPGILFMAIVFVAQGMSDDLWSEKDQGTLRRFIGSPQGMSLFFASKVLAGTALMASVALVALLIGFTAFELPLARIPAGLLWCAFVGAALLCIFSLIQLFGTNRRAAGLLTNMIMFPLIMLGGSFFPFESMPGWMVAVGRWTPNGLGVWQLKALLFGEPQFGPLLTAAAGIGLPAILVFVLTVRLLRKRFPVS